MKRLLKVLCAINLILMMGLSIATTAHADEPLKVVSSFSLLTDMLESIGQDHIEVYNLVPVGTDPHEYEPLPEDIMKATDADLMFYNGLNLEGSENGWFMKLANSVKKSPEQLIEVAKDVEPQYLKDEEGRQEINPHAFADPNVGIKMAQRIVEVLKEQDPNNEMVYQENGEAYIKELEAIRDEYEEKLGSLEGNQRNFIASEHAFQYMTQSFNLNHGYIWAIDTDENGSPAQIQSAIQWVKDNNPPVLFVESNVDRRPMQTVSKETGVEIYEKPVYSDEIGEKGSPADTYLKYLQTNLDVIYNGLNQ